MTARVLVLPGFGNSGPDHWQTLWEEAGGYERVNQKDWAHPDRDAWVAELDRAVKKSNEPAVIVAHSLGCIVVAHWAAYGLSTNVKGALLVAPADADSELHTPDEVRSFSPIPTKRLPFPTIVVASRTDPYIRMVRAKQLAENWGARLVDVGRLGHVNADSGIGEWDEGKGLLAELLGN